MRSPLHPKLSKSAIVRSDITINKTAMEETAMPFPYPKIIPRTLRI
ncbi:MAG: hypothetical protein M3N42_10210 [Cyanobacteriota bacterium]|nr:hypothetical protein [Cyanobacteriota bacterium]